MGRIIQNIYAYAWGELRGVSRFIPYRVLVGVVVSAIVLLVGGVMWLNHHYQTALHQELNQYATQQQERIRWEVNTEIKSLQKQLLLVGLSLVHVSESVEILRREKSEPTHLKKIIADWSVFSGQESLWVQLVSKDGISLYRSWTPERGDDLNKVRPDLADVLKNPRVTTSLSIGRYTLSAKAIVPVYDEDGKGEFLGVLEVISDLQPVLTSLAQENLLSALLVEARFAKQLSSRKHFVRFGNWLVLSAVDDPVLIEALYGLDINALAQQGILIDGQRVWWWVPIKTTAQGEIGALVIKKDLVKKTAELMMLLSQEKWAWMVVVALCAIFLPALVALFYLVYKERNELLRTFDAGMELRVLMHLDRVLRVNARMRALLMENEVDLQAFMQAPFQYVRGEVIDLSGEVVAPYRTYLPEHPGELVLIRIIVGRETKLMKASLVYLEPQLALITLLNVEDELEEIHLLRQRAAMLEENTLSQDELADWLQETKHHDMCALMIDIDHYAEVNARFGDDVSNQIMQQIIRLLRSHLQEGDALVRWKNHKFLMLIAKLPRAQAQRFANQLREEVKQHFEDQNKVVTISIGVACDKTEAFEKMVEMADAALEEAQATGANQVVLDKGV